MEQIALRGENERLMNAAAKHAEHNALLISALSDAAMLLRPLVQDGVEIRVKNARTVLAEIDSAKAAAIAR